MNRFFCFAVVLGFLVAGCADPNAPTTEPPQEAPKESIIGKTTQDVGEYDSAGADVEADLQVDPNSNPLAAATGSYKFATATISKQAVERALQLFNAEHERYPRDHAEFMEVIVKRNNMQFPVLPGRRRYQYDVENHVLRIVEAKKINTDEPQKGQ